jgi:Ice-binding-like
MAIDVARTAGAGGRLIRNVLIGTGIVLATLAAAPDRETGPAPLPLRSAESYAVLAAGSVAGTGEPVVEGIVGVYPGTTQTGFPPGAVHGVVRLGGPDTQQAQHDLRTAHEEANRRTATGSVGPELGGRRLGPGVYRATESVTLNGTLTLDAQGDAAAVFVFQLPTALTTAENSRIEVVNSPRPGCNLFWAVGDSVTLGAGSQLVGTIMATNSITAEFATTVTGGALSRNGDVKLDNAVVRRPDCTASRGPAAPSGSVAPSGPSAPSRAPSAGGSAKPGAPATRPTPGGSAKSTPHQHGSPSRATPGGSAKTSPPRHGPPSQSNSHTPIR